MKMKISKHILLQTGKYYYCADYLKLKQDLFDTLGQLVVRRKSSRMNNISYKQISIAKSF